MTTDSDARQVTPKVKTTFDLLFNQEHYNSLLAKSQEENVKIVHVRKFDEQGDYEKQGGATIAVGRNFDRSRYAKVAAALCSHNENFNKKLGSYLALKAYYDGKVIPIYVPHGSTPSSVAVSMFEAMHGF